MPICAAINKYGWDAFEVELLEQCSTRAQLGEAEQRWIATLGTMVPNGYNVRAGGFHAPQTEEHKKRVGDFFRGRKRPASECKHISEMLKGRTITWGAKISAAMKGRPGVCSLGFQGHKHSCETRQKMSHNNGHRRLTPDQEMQIVAEYSVSGVSQQKLADKHGVKQSAISKVIRRSK